MNEVTVLTDLPDTQFVEVAMNKAVELGYNCYSKPARVEDYVSEEGHVFHYSWRGKVVAITVKNKDNA